MPSNNCEYIPNGTDISKYGNARRFIKNQKVCLQHLGNIKNGIYNSPIHTPHGTKFHKIKIGNTIKNVQASLVGTPHRKRNLIKYYFKHKTNRNNRNRNRNRNKTIKRL